MQSRDPAQTVYLLVLTRAEKHTRARRAALRKRWIDRWWTQFDEAEGTTLWDDVAQSERPVEDEVFSRLHREALAAEVRRGWEAAKNAASEKTYFRRRRRR